MTGDLGGWRTLARRTGIATPLGEVMAIILLCPILLAVPLWNGFPIIFYDTGAYLAQGILGAYLPERSAVYSLFLKVFGAETSLWRIGWIQALLTSILMVEFLRVELPRLSLFRTAAVAVLVCTITGIGWYVGQIEPDCFAAITVLALYLLLFRSRELGAGRNALLVGIAGLAIACHPSNLGLSGGLVLAAGFIFLARKIWAWLPMPRLSLAVCSFALGLCLVIAANYGYTREIYVSRTGSVFLFARMMQDGIIKRLLDETCPTAGYEICPYRDRLKPRADAWLWDNDSPFKTLGGFTGTDIESGILDREALKRYPWMNVRAAVIDMVHQFFKFGTGDQIEPQQWVLFGEFKQVIPSQLAAYIAARQQRERFNFAAMNRLHITVGAISMAALAVALILGWRRRDALKTILPAFVLVALLGNAFVCGVLANPHDRYQSRLVWLPTFVLLVMAGSFSLRRQAESGT